MNKRSISFRSKHKAKEIWFKIHDYLDENGSILTKEELGKLDKKIEELIQLDDEGLLKKFYNSIKDQLDMSAKIKLFRSGRLKNVTIKNLTITQKMYNILLANMFFKEVSLDNVIIDVPIEDLLVDGFDKSLVDIRNVSMPQITPLDYGKNGSGYFRKESRMALLPFTIKTNLYLELGRQCNAKCKFCRNHCLKQQEYNIDNIEKSLKLLGDKSDSVVIGGGEPTTLPDDVKRIITISKDNRVKPYIFTNATASKDMYESLIHNECRINVSRHSINDDINADIFGINEKRILTLCELKKINSHNVITLSCTCVKGAVDTANKIIEYIKIAHDKYGFNNIMFCNLHKSASLDIEDTKYDNMLVDDTIFMDAIEILQMQGFEFTYPIVSTGGYEMYILKKGTISIVFKKYLSKKELELKWLKAVKRTFDLSMDPSGNVYSNWSETGKKIVLK